MIKPEPEVIHALASSIHQYPILKEWIDNWRMHELEQLPNVATKRVGPQTINSMRSAT